MAATSPSTSLSQFRRRSTSELIIEEWTSSPDADFSASEDDPPLIATGKWAYDRYAASQRGAGESEVYCAGIPLAFSLADSLVAPIGPLPGLYRSHDSGR
jgi:hypothetical protein